VAAGELQLCEMGAAVAARRGTSAAVARPAMYQAAAPVLDYLPGWARCPPV